MEHALEHSWHMKIELCEECDDELSEFYCQECKELLCQRCDSNLHFKAARKEHTRDRTSHSSKRKFDEAKSSEEFKTPSNGSRKISHEDYSVFYMRKEDQDF